MLFYTVTCPHCLVISTITYSLKMGELGNILCPHCRQGIHVKANDTHKIEVVQPKLMAK
jgi:hypothetical protein